MGVANLHERDGVSLFMALDPEARRDRPRSGDLEKIEIARAMSEVFPFSPREELAKTLTGSSSNSHLWHRLAMINWRLGTRQ